MAQQIVAAVRKAEIQAEQTEKRAIAESVAIRQQSQKGTELTIIMMTNEEKQSAETALVEAKILGSQWLKDAEDAAEKEIIQLRETAKLKETAIISLIITELI